MKLVATHIPTAHAAAFEFTEPGGTIGRCPGNHLLLSEDTRVGRIQAVVRIKDGALSLKNVSSQTDIMVNGQSLSLLQEMPITDGDTLLIGDYMLRTGPTSESRASQPASAAGMATEPELATERVQGSAMEAGEDDGSDIFKELLDGPGVLPVGQSADAGALHPFELASQAPRNHPDPIQQLQEDPRSRTYGEPTPQPLDTAPAHQDTHILSDPVPTTLKLDKPWISQPKSLIDEALAQGHASASHHENR